MDPIFHLGFLSAFLGKLDPALANRLERYIQANGFDTFLCALVAAPDAMKLISRGCAKALEHAEARPFDLASIRFGIYSKVQVGIKTSR